MINHPYLPPLPALPLFINKPFIFVLIHFWFCDPPRLAKAIICMPMGLKLSVQQRV